MIDGYREARGWDEGLANTDKLEHVQYIASAMAQLEVAVRASEYISGDEIEERITRLREGEENVLIAFALTLFPNLESINFQISHFVNQPLDHIFHRIADTNNPGGPLAKLISVNIGVSSSSSSVYPDAIEIFAELPSIKVIKCRESRRPR